MNTPSRISRRRFLRGTGVSLELPLLGAMTPLRGRAAAEPPRRMICINTTLGLHTPNLFPEKAGKDYELTPRSGKGTRQAAAAAERPAVLWFIWPA